jgi:thymidine kinase
MFSGKTTRLIEMHQYSNFEPFEKIAIKPLMDTRYHAGSVNTHSGIQLPGHRVSKPEEIPTLVGNQIKEIFIDEIQFFGDSIYQVVLDLTLQGLRIVAAGLDKDFMGNDFGPMPRLKQFSNNHIFLKAKCEVCGQPAAYTFRKSIGEAQIMIGHKDLYEARCETHWKEGMQSLR